MSRHKDRILMVLTEEEKNKLIKKLEVRGFRVNSQGHVDVENPRINHPRFSDNPLPVAYIGKSDYYIELVNSDKRVLRRYQTQIKKIL